MTFGFSRAKHILLCLMLAGFSSQFFLLRTQAADGLFGTYFERMITTPCAPGFVLTGFSSGSTNYGTRVCTSVNTVLASAYGGSRAVPGQAMIGISSTGTILYGPVNWVSSGSSISYTLGNVGIGRTNPRERLDVNGNIQANLSRVSNASISSTLVPDGLRIAHTGAILGLSVYRDASHLHANSFIRHYGTGGLYLYTNNYSPIYFVTDNTTRMTILGNGNVGIGTFSPTSRLHVNGNASFSGTISATTPTASNHVATKGYVDSLRVSGYSTGSALISFTRTCNGVASCNDIFPNDIIQMEWSVINAINTTTGVVLRCNGPVSGRSNVDRYIGSVGNIVETHDQLIKAGSWVPGKYNCEIRATGLNGAVSVAGYSFTLHEIGSPQMISFRRTCHGVDTTRIAPGCTHGATWTTQNAQRLEYMCAGPSNRFTNAWFNIPLNRPTDSETYNELMAAGWTPGSYNCLFRLIGINGATRYVSSNFEILGNNANISFRRTCNGVDTTRIAPGCTHSATWTTQNTHNLDYFCTGPSNPFTNVWINIPLSRPSHSETYNELIAAGWTPGNYSCSFRLTAFDGSYKFISTNFSIEAR